jgi:hypothetical protein
VSLINDILQEAIAEVNVLINHHFGKKYMSVPMYTANLDMISADVHDYLINELNLYNMYSNRISVTFNRDSGALTIKGVSHYIRESITG